MTGVLEPQPGAYTGQEQARRTQALRDACELMAGRSVPYQAIWAIARWLYNGEVAT